MERSDRNSDYRTVRLAAVCGMIAPFTFIAAVLVAGTQRPGYSHAMQYISELGEFGDTSSYIMNFGGFFLFGVLLIALSYGFRRRMDFKPLSGNVSYSDVLRTLTPILLTITGVGYMAAAFLTGENLILHGMAGLFAGVYGALPLITLYTFRKDPRWDNFRAISLGVFIAQLSINLTFRLFYGDTIGLVQREVYVSILVWVEALSINLYRLA